MDDGFARPLVGEGIARVRFVCSDGVTWPYDLLQTKNEMKRQTEVEDARQPEAAAATGGLRAASPVAMDDGRAEESYW